jgi:photosystem II stability/assembly factor-like uncharacterized protein
MRSRSRIVRIAIAALALAAPALAQAIERCDKNHYILTERCIAQWTAVNSGLTDLDVRVIAIDPVRNTTLYAGGPTGVFKSIDGGARWDMTGLEMASRNAIDTAAALQRFAYLPASWTAVSIVMQLAIEPTNPKTLYAATSWSHGCSGDQRRVFKSADGGETWTDSVGVQGIGCNGVSFLAFAPSGPATLYLASPEWMDGYVPVLKSNDGAATWSYVPYPSVHALAIDPLDLQTMYAGTPGYTSDLIGYPNGVLKTSDGGATWAVTPLAASAVTALTLDPGNSRTLYAATSDYAWSAKSEGVFKSVDGGETWAAIGNKLPRLAVTALIVDAGDSNRIYVATKGGGVYRSADGGATWAAFSSGLQSLEVNSLKLVAGSPNTLYAGTPAGVFKTAD